jgi:hypothetical protein
MPTYDQLKRQVDLASRRKIGGRSVLDTVKRRAQDSPIPGAFSFAVAILSQEGRIADPAAFQNGWRSTNGPEKSPWQVHPRWHDFAKDTPATDFEAYTNYAMGLLEDGWYETGTLYGAARRYNSFNACSDNREDACRNGRRYAQSVIDRLPKIQRALKAAGYQIGPDVSSRPSVVGGGGGGASLESGLSGSLGGLIAAVVLGGGTLYYVSIQEEPAPRPSSQAQPQASS